MTSTGKLPRLAIADWGHAWLTRQEDGRGEFRPMRRVLDELVERGYNALRVDAFPHLVAPRSDGVVTDRYQVRAGRRSPQVQPRKALVELATLARERDIRLWLTSSFLSDTQARRNFVRRPGDFVDVWLHTLTLLDREGLLDAIVAVDFCHEFGEAASTPSAHQQIFQRRIPLPRFAAWNPDAEARAANFVQEVPRTLRGTFSRIAYGVSTSASTGRYIRRMDTSELDFLDAHIWMDDELLPGLFTGVRPPLPDAARRLQTRATEVALRLGGGRWLRQAELHLDDLAEFARLRRLAPVVTGGWLHWRDADRAMVQEVSEALVCAGLAAGLPVLAASSRARPDQHELWADVEWHRYITGTILAGY